MAVPGSDGSRERREYSCDICMCLPFRKEGTETPIRLSSQTTGSKCILDANLLNLFAGETQLADESLTWKPYPDMP